MGRYVWRKSTGLFVADPTLVLDLKKDAYPTSTLKVTCNDVDLTVVADIKTFLNGFKATKNANYEFYLTGNTLYLRYYSPTQSGNLSYREVYNFNVVSAHYMEMSIDSTEMPYASLPYTMKFEGTKSITTPTPIGFVISNNQDMYPDKAVKNGYYYELIGTIPNANTMNLSESTISAVIDDVQKGVKNGLL